MWFFGRIQDWIYDLWSHGYFVPKETKNLKTDFSGVTAHFQPGMINVICIKLKLWAKVTTFSKFRVHWRKKIAVETYLDCSPWFTQMAGICIFTRLPLAKRRVFFWMQESGFQFFQKNAPWKYRFVKDLSSSSPEKAHLHCRHKIVSWPWKRLGFRILSENHPFTELQLKTFLSDSAQIFRPISLQFDVQNGVSVFQFIDLSWFYTILCLASQSKALFSIW